MVTLDAVVRVPAAGTGMPPPWPAVPMGPDTWLVLDGNCTDGQVGLFVAALADMFGVPTAGGPVGVVDALTTEDHLIAPGGLRLRDVGTGATVEPGCCAGLEDWRDWTRVIAGGSPWLGHDPGPEFEFRGDRVRVWQDGGPHRHDPRPAGAHVDLPRSDLLTLLTGVHRDLVGFLGALDRWTRRVGLGHRGAAFVAAVDTDFVVTAALDLPAVRH